MPILIFLFIFTFAFVEFKLLALVFHSISSRYDAFSAIFLILAAFVLGFSLGARILRRQSRTLMARMQSGAVDGKDATRGFLGFLAGALFILPGFGSDILALLCLFPPTAWLLNQILGRLLRKMMRKANFSYFGSFGGSGGGGFSAGAQMGQTSSRNASEDPTIIDVEVIDKPKHLP